jgi:hypothetical protein
MNYHHQIELEAARFDRRQARITWATALGLIALIGLAALT